MANKKEHRVIIRNTPIDLIHQAAQILARNADAMPNVDVFGVYNGVGVFGFDRCWYLYRTKAATVIYLEPMAAP